MKYFIDTEFTEGFHRLQSGDVIHCMQLISIGIVSEDGRTYYAINQHFNPNLANQWVKDNVINKLETDPALWKPTGQIAEEIEEFCGENPEFYAYYADYDWVIFCSLFGSMISLPEHFPMYCRDLKQTLDEVAYNIGKDEKAWIDNPDATTALELVKALPGYPKQGNEHNALDDAWWDKKLYDFLTDLSQTFAPNGQMNTE